MDLGELWQKALKKTEVIKPRIVGLSASSSTKLPYIFMAPSALNSGDTVVRRGEVVVGKPTIILPHNLPQFDGFEFEPDMHFNEDTVLNFLLVRGVSFPSLKYNNQTNSVDVHEGSLSHAVKHYQNILQKKEDVATTLLTGPEEAWQFSVMIFIAMQAERSASSDIKSMIEEWRRRGLSN